MEMACGKVINIQLVDSISVYLRLPSLDSLSLNSHLDVTNNNEPRDHVAKGYIYAYIVHCLSAHWRVESISSSRVKIRDWWVYEWPANLSAAPTTAAIYINSFVPNLQRRFASPTNANSMLIEMISIFAVLMAEKWKSAKYFEEKN